MTEFPLETSGIREPATLRRWRGTGIETVNQLVTALVHDPDGVAQALGLDDDEAWDLLVDCVRYLPKEIGEALTGATLGGSRPGVSRPKDATRTVDLGTRTPTATWPGGTYPGMRLIITVKLRPWDNPQAWRWFRRDRLAQELGLGAIGFDPSYPPQRAWGPHSTRNSYWNFRTLPIWDSGNIQRFVEKKGVNWVAIENPGGHAL